GGETFVTHTGETRTVNLQEGSVVYMNTRTEMRWSGTDDDRRVDFTEGEALFEIVHDAQHPFHVLLDNSEIRVLGTRFNVYRKPDGSTLVTVLDGRVEVSGRGGNGTPGWARTLQKDQEIEYGANGLTVEPHVTQARKAEQWRTGVYRFQDETV